MSKCTKMLYELLELEENGFCADCGKKDPDWASIPIGVFICVNCSGIHRDLTIQDSRVRSCNLDKWTFEHVELMAQKGNKIVNSQLERHVPPFYKKPCQNDPRVYREHYIWAKYARKDFESTRPMYVSQRKEGMLMKRGKTNKTFRPRLFVLEKHTLKYFVKSNVPKQVIATSLLHVCLNPEVIGHPHGIQLSFSDVGSRNFRHIYVYCEDAKGTVDWYLEIRATIYRRLKSENPEKSEDEVLALLENHNGKQGYLFKTGPKQTESFRKRWFKLQNRSLIYFENPLDAHPIGEIYIGNSDDGYGAVENWGLRKAISGVFPILLQTPERDFLFHTDERVYQQSWLKKIRSIVGRPMSCTEVGEFDIQKECLKKKYK